MFVQNMFGTKVNARARAVAGHNRGSIAKISNRENIFGQKIICLKKFGEEIDGQKIFW